jgi:flagellar L-ring protein precursor FlgH
MKRLSLYISMLAVAQSGCVPVQDPNPYVPAMRYSETKPDPTQRGLAWQGAVYEDVSEGKAQLRMVSAAEGARRPQVKMVADTAPHSLTPELGGDVRVMRSSEQLPQSYRGPLELGDPGVTSSLWRESRAGNDVFRDFRAFQPMDLLSIVVDENSRGMHDADTEVKSKSEILTAIQNFFGVEGRFDEGTSQFSYPADLSNLIRASSKNDFKGEGLTNRLAQLTARISAVVVEVLPSGLLRIEGEKIISVNNEEQVMVISGLVRQRDVSSDNEVLSSKIAQMRIDYYGKGVVGAAQYGGWLSRLMRFVWPF